MFEGFFQQNQNWKGKLRETLKEYFNETELREICFDLGFDYETLHAGTGDKSKFVMELINQCYRQGRVEELIAVCKRQRPNIDWGTIEKGISNARNPVRFNLINPKRIIGTIAVVGSGLVSVMCIAFFGAVWWGGFPAIKPSSTLPVPTLRNETPRVKNPTSPAVTQPPTMFPAATPIVAISIPSFLSTPSSLNEVATWFPSLNPLAGGAIEEVDFRTLGFGADDLADFERMGRLSSYQRTYLHPSYCNSADGLEAVYIQMFYFKTEWGAEEFIKWATIDWTFPGVIETQGVGDQSYYRRRDATILEAGNCEVKPIQFTFKEANIAYRVIVYTKVEDPRWPDEASVEKAIEISRYVESRIR